MVDDPADARSAYAERLSHMTSRIVGAVHDDGPDTTARMIDRALAEPAPPGVDPVHALVTVLAAQVSPDATPADRFGWVNEPPRPSTRHQAEDDRRLDMLLAVAFEAGPVRLPDYDTRLARVIDGDEPLSVLPTEYAAAAVEVLRRRGLSVTATAARVNTSHSTAKELRRRYAEDEDLPADVAPARLGAPRVGAA